MRYHCFVFNWPGQQAKVVETCAQLRACGHEPTVINSAAAPATAPRWHHIGADAFFSAQFNAALALFRETTDEIFVHIQGDALCPDWAGLLASATRHFDQYNYGVYAPNVNWTFYDADKVNVRKLEPDLYEVKNTDCTCWFIHRDLLRNFPFVDVTVNKFGWGIDSAVMHVAQKMRRKILRNYAYTVLHPRSRGYASTIADGEKNVYLQHFVATFDAFNNL